ncbi:MAG TPA: LysR family transcriptional regulator [Hydrogenophaga sp.]|uniref:LysR family transcriptional regulator n=1 Tax=Hydrogenophaga sp. TaxID=1904254 RepID=UPI002CA2B856|nr:LysR family transcriptional regulator [Hydrogenophaga sp.]HMN92165.1 LysR family transcriptional regulator [Hydrogenophaga sp.]HMP11189.1 LysR family transcriptional regulator [Hydrogenophaga sp.]
MKLEDIDLNLLMVFDRLMREQRVSRVAESLGMSQPAVSHALRRLRTLLDDELFLRQPAGMVPTPYARQLASPVSQALQVLRSALHVRASFDPGASVRRFQLAMSDVGQMYFLPALMAELALEAPGVTVQVTPVADPDLREAMTTGRIDLALGALPRLQAGFYRQTLFHQRYVVLMRAGHPLAGGRQVSALRFRRATHVKVAATGTGHGLVEEALEALGLERHIVLTVPHHVALGQVLSETDLIATVPERFAEKACPPFGLVARPLAIPLPRSEIAQHWHGHLHRDPGHQWLRQRVARLFGRPSAIETAAPD